MAAYGSLVSLTNLIERVHEYNARNPVFDDRHLMQFNSLEGKALFLQKFLETYSSGGRREGEALEGQIADLILDAQDLIESRIVFLIYLESKLIAGAVHDDFEATDRQIESYIADDIHALCLISWKTDSNNHFSEVLQKLMEVADLIKNEATKIAQTASTNDEQPRYLTSLSSDNPIPTPAAHEKDSMVIFGEALNQVMDKLTRRIMQLETIPITGMGGIGKTTLARSIYDNPRVLQHFDIRSWVTVSQEFDAQAVLFGIVSGIELEKCSGDGKQKLKLQQELKQLGYDQLGTKLHKHLLGRRYLVILDDVWSIEACDKIKRYLPDDNKGSRIMVTTRLANFAVMIDSSHNFEMNLLDENEGWCLLKEKVFSKQSCPTELEKIGKLVAKSCKGLPLSITVMGGLLTKSLDQAYWKSIAEDVNTSPNSQVSDHCLKILYTSYRHLPIHLKPCFLYFGTYCEDSDIKVSDLIHRWVARGFLKPREGKTLEEIGHEYLKVLVERNLLIVSKYTFRRRIKFCKIHDLLRDLCLREVKEKRFLSQSFRRIHSRVEKCYFPECDYDFQPSPRYIPYSVYDLKPLRVFKTDHMNGLCERPNVINVRYLQTEDAFHTNMELLWNIQTLIAKGLKLPSEIWEMPQVRHLVSMRYFSIDEHSGANGDGRDIVVLKNLQTIKVVNNFRCSEEILGKIPNLKKLGVYYDGEQLGKVSSQDLKNIGRLTKLEYLYIFFDNCNSKFQSKLDFPQSIRKLELTFDYFEWESMGRKIGCLPNLEKLLLKYSYGSVEWHTVEGEFSSLRYLFLIRSNLVRWTTDGDSLPCLEHLVLWNMEKLVDIPFEIGDIQTLQSIQLSGVYTRNCLIRSAKEIQVYQREWGNLDLHLHISYNFHGHIYEEELPPPIEALSGLRELPMEVPADLGPDFQIWELQARAAFMEDFYYKKVKEKIKN